MSTNKNDKLIFEASGHLDDDLISEVLGKYEAKKSITQNRIARMNRGIKIAVAIAACLVLLAVAIPTATIVIEHGEHTPPTAGVENSGVEAETGDVFDGSRGLQYAVNEDGKTASLISFHKCTDEVMIIASHYNGLPVTVIMNQPYYELEYVPVDHGYYNKKVKRLVISDTVEEVYRDVLSKMPNLESVYIGASVKEISFFNSSASKLSSIEISPENKKFTVKDNCLIEVATKTLYKGCHTSVIPDDGSIEIIRDNAFFGAQFENVDLPEGIKVIELDAFHDCDKIKSIVLPKSLERLEPSAFSHCDELEVFDLNGFTYLPQSTLSYCKMLKEVKGSENLVYIGKHALGGCRQLRSIDLGLGLEKLDELAFSSYNDQIGNPITLNYVGTKADWEAIEKDADWNYRSNALSVVCIDGTIYPVANTKSKGTLETEN